MRACFDNRAAQRPRPLIGVNVAPKLAWYSDERVGRRTASGLNNSPRPALSARAAPNAQRQRVCRKAKTLPISRLERNIVAGSRFLTLAAVLGSLAGSILMFALGLINIYVAFGHIASERLHDEEVFGTGAVISVIEGLDRFLIAIVLLYFAYGVYALFIHPRQSEEELALPAWLHVMQIGQLKQVVAELIVVILFVLFLRQALQEFSGPDLALGWAEIGGLAVLPVSTVLLALALRLVELHPKSPRLPPPEDRRKGAG